jgi:hypothetical protein
MREKFKIGAVCFGPASSLLGSKMAHSFLLQPDWKTISLSISFFLSLALLTSDRRRRRHGLHLLHGELFQHQRLRQGEGQGQGLGAVLQGGRQGPRLPWTAPLRGQGRLLSLSLPLPFLALNPRDDGLRLVPFLDCSAPHLLARVCFRNCLRF